MMLVWSSFKMNLQTAWSMCMSPNRLALVTTIARYLGATNQLISSVTRHSSSHRNGKPVVGSCAMSTAATTLPEQVDVTVFLKHPVSYSMILPPKWIERSLDIAFSCSFSLYLWFASCLFSRYPSSNSTRSFGESSWTSNPTSGSWRRFMAITQTLSFGCMITTRTLKLLRASSRMTHSSPTVRK